MGETRDFFSMAQRNGLLNAIHAYTLKYRIIAKFIVSGAIGAITMLFFLIIFTEVFDFWYLISTVLAFIIATCVSFSLHKFWTFRDKNLLLVKNQASSFFVVQGILFILNTSLMYFLVDIVGIWYILSQVIVSGTLALVSFFIYRFKIFTSSEYKRIIQDPRA